MTEIESSIVAAWCEAATDLGIQFTSPFEATLQGEPVQGLGLIHHFGRRLGTIISAIDHSTPHVPDSARDDYYASQLSDSYIRYRRQFFIDTLDDWQFFGPDSQRPSWYTGRPWS